MRPFETFEVKVGDRVRSRFGGKVFEVVNVEPRDVSLRGEGDDELTHVGSVDGHVMDHYWEKL